ncbi:unnamed protein product [Urochloa humidicola]
MAKNHVLMLPFPAQGHVTPLMELSHRLVDHGFEVTFVNTAWSTTVRRVRGLRQHGHLRPAPVQGRSWPRGLSSPAGRSFGW